ncbi:MAG: hypothetical protein ACRD3G_04130 [Vicinamibacterales bacterium]
MTKATKKSASVDRAFGEDSRLELLQEYFSGSGPVTPANAWVHVYRLLLWTDRTTGLAHCYESDKAQPGRPWYGRSLAFHDWLAKTLNAAPHKIGEDIDWLFRRCTERLAVIAARHQERRAPIAAAQRKAFDGRNLPEPGEDPIFETMIREELGSWLAAEPPPDALRRLAQRIQTYFRLENKRKNLVGEGFEDVLAAIVQRLPESSALQVHARPLLHSLPGFRPPPGVEKPRKVDVAVIRPDQRRILVSAKWSVRADREEQFGVDFDAYARLEDLGRDFDFVLVSNEFDAARIAAACDRRRQNAFLFNAVVHVNPAGPIAAYGTTGRGSANRLPEHIQSGRLISLEQWLERLTTPRS